MNYLLFTIGNKNYAFDINSIEEIHELIKWHSIPANNNNLIRGLVIIDRRTFPIVFLDKIEISEFSSNPKYLIEIKNNAGKFFVICDKLPEIYIDKEKMLTQKEENLEENNFLKEIMVKDKKEIRIIDTNILSKRIFNGIH